MSVNPWEHAVIKQADALKAGDESWTTTRELIKLVPKRLLMELLLTDLQAAARNHIREETLKAERKAFNQPEPEPERFCAEQGCYKTVSKGRWRCDKHSTPIERDDNLPHHLGKKRSYLTSQSGAKTKRYVYEGCDCDACEGNREWQSWSNNLGVESRRIMVENLNNAMESYAANLRLEWEQELLESTFALRDGTLITWGEATIDQHEERVKIFMDNVTVNAEGAARHTKAIDALKKAEADCLNDLVSVHA